jgi:hypothetical protein
MGTLMRGSEKEICAGYGYFNELQEKEKLKVCSLLLTPAHNIRGD